QSHPREGKDRQGWRVGDGPAPPVSTPTATVLAAFPGAVVVASKALPAAETTGNVAGPGVWAVAPIAEREDQFEGSQRPIYDGLMQNRSLRDEASAVRDQTASRTPIFVKADATNEQIDGLTT